jgi:hypothetical protein
MEDFLTNLGCFPFPVAPIKAEVADKFETVLVCLTQET